MSVEVKVALSMLFETRRYKRTQIIVYPQGRSRIVVTMNTYYCTFPLV